VLLTLIRHGETEHNRGQLTLGRADVPLNHRGRLQARALAASFEHPPAAIYASPLQRCRETAQAIAAATSGSVTVEPDLIEMDVGEMEHLTREELRDRYPDFLRLWLAAPAEARMPLGEVRMPGGETLGEVQDRAWSAIERVAAAHPPSDSGRAAHVVAVTHNFVILTLACRALGLPLDNFRRFRTTLAGRTLIDMRQSPPTLISWNDTAHLRATGLG